MTIYSDFREILVASFPLQMAIDQALRDFPKKLKEAIRAYMSAPIGLSQVGSMMFGCDTEFVDLYKPVFDEDHHRHFVRDLNNQNDGLYVRNGHEYKCCIGICFDDTTIPQDMPIARIEFTIIEFSEKTIIFCIDNLDGAISVEDVNDPESYARAAKLVIDRLIEFAKNQPLNRGLRTPIGFRPARETR